MKRIIFLFASLFCCIAHATETIKWYIDGNLYDTTTCESGDNITPPTPTTKYGYHLNKWAYIDSTLAPSRSYSHTGLQCYRNWESYSCTNLDLGAMEVKLEYTDYTIYGKAICSNTRLNGIGRIGYPDESAQNINDGGCYCKATHIVDKTGIHYTVNGSWVQDYQYSDGCTKYCPAHCIENVRNNAQGARKSFLTIQIIPDNE